MTLLAFASLASAPVLQAQSGLVTFGASTTSTSSPPTASFGGGPTLTFSSQILSGFGASGTVQTGNGEFYTPAVYSGQSMVYGFNSGVGNVLELTLLSAAGFDLSLTSALFGAYPNASKYVTYQLFNADYSQSTDQYTVLTGGAMPANPMFAASGWESTVRLQFTQTTSAGVLSGRGPYDVGIQDIAYTVSAVNSNVVPEPSTWMLTLTGVGAILVMQRRRARQR